MGNLVRKPAQLLLNTITATSITYEVGEFLRFKDYNDINVTDTVMKFKKSSYAAGTAQVTTVTPVIAYPGSAQDGAQLFVTIKGKEELGWSLGPGKADNFFLSGVTFQGYLASLAAENAGFLAAADYQALVNQIVDAINGHALFGKLMTATRSTNNLVLTSKDARFQFEVAVAAQYGTITATTPGVYPTLHAEDVQRIFAIKSYDAGQSLDKFPSPSVTDWSKYYFKVKKNAYALEGANHLDYYYEEFEFYIPTDVAEADHTTQGAWWDEKIFDFLTEIGYSDPHGDDSPWGLVEGATS